MVFTEAVFKGTRRVVAIFICLTLLFTVICARLTYLTFANNGKMKVQSTQSSYSVNIGKYRGDIFDCNGQKLVNEKDEYYVAVMPNDSSIKKYSALLSNTQKHTLKNGFPVALKLSEKPYSDDVFTVKQRYISDICTHIIGYIDENGGVCGIEKAYDDILCSNDADIIFRRDALGKTLCGITPKLTPKEKTGNVYLTIDKTIQSVATAAAKRYLSTGAAVVLDNKTGKIKAICSVPDYNQNDVAASLNDSNTPFINRALSAYSSGSVFKLCIAAAALENNVVGNHTCLGKIKIGNVDFSCKKKHGEMSLETAIAYSCNIYFISLGQTLGANNAYKTAKMMGFCTQNTLAPYIADAKGSLNDKVDLQNNPAALANFSFGQGNVMTTPLQIASMVQCIANGGKRITPSLIESTTDKNGHKSINENESGMIVMSKKNSDILKKCMVSTVDYGTGTAAKIGGVTVGGKTATAQTGVYDKSNREYLQAWFAGFAEKDDKSYTIVVMAEHGISGGQSSAPVFREIAENIL